MANVISMENFLHTKKQIQQSGMAKVKDLLVEKAAVDERMPNLPTVMLREQAVIYSANLLMEAHSIARAHHFAIRVDGDGKYVFYDLDKD